MERKFISSNTKKDSSAKLNGLILAGGKSARMGRDKSLIQYHNVAQREYLFTMLGNFCDEVFTSCKAIKDIPPGLNPLPDKFNFDSPLNGILSAFSRDHNAAWLTIPVDMPLIDVDILFYLITNRDLHKVGTCFFDSDGKNPEPLVAIWEKQAYPLLLDFYNGGNISPRDFLKREKTNIIQIPDRNALVNINNPAELDQFKKSQS